jgi:hypothetical protein
MNSMNGGRTKAALIAVRLCALWLLAGAVAKLFLGTPKDLPDLVRKLSPLPSLDLTLRVAIAVELAIVWTALLKPRFGWPAIVALFVFFEFVLASQLAAGAASCGCFGATIKVSPYVMVAIDGALLAFLLATRPWRSLGTGGSTKLLAAAIAISAALPWIVIPSEHDVATQRYVEMHPDRWLQKNVFEIGELAPYIPADKLPTDGKIVLWRQGCTHCAAHLRKMAREDDGSQPIVLLQIRDDLTASREVDAMPNGQHVTSLATPENKEMVITTPWEFQITGGVVTNSVSPEQAEALDGAAAK